jgi:radical SAM protein with 4Fe4S-binding SPASM domain
MVAVKNLSTLMGGITPRRVCNLLVGQLEHRMGLSRLHNLPAKLSMESGNLCNLQCPLCPTGQRDPSARKGLLPFQTFKKALDELGPGLLLLRLYNWGEPLLNPELASMIEYASAMAIPVKISTNLSLKLEEAQIRALLSSGLRKMYVSCNAASPETYPIYHVGGDFHLVMENLRLLAVRKRELNSLTELVWLFHVFSHNEHEIEKARVMAGELGVRLELKKMRPDMGKEIFETAEEALRRDGHWLPKNPEYNLFDMGKRRPKKTFSCDLLWTETVINWDGAVLPCCSVYSEKYSFGNLLERPFKEIWNGEMYVAARKEVLSQEENGTWTVCRACKKSGFLHG